MKEKIYGIDLGTTYSLIGCDNHLITGLVSSKVDLKRKESVENNAVGPDILGSYKVNMTIGKGGEKSIEASTIVLKTLAEKVRIYTGDNVKKVVVSVPAYFVTVQRQAVKIAVENAGLELVAMINEPTAAAIHICNIEDTKGIFAVYDLGGGTFDCTIIDSRYSTYRVLATDGLKLGGDDLDMYMAEYIVDYLEIPMYKRTQLAMAKLKEECIKCKIYLQQEYILNFHTEDFKSYSIQLPEEMYHEDTTEFSFSMPLYHTCVREVFSPTVRKLNMLLKQHVPQDMEVTLAFVGGSTYCYYLREYVLSNIDSDKVDFRIDKQPDFSVALGAIRYATSIQDSVDGKPPKVEFQDITKQLSVEDKRGNAIVVIKANSPVPVSESIIVSNGIDTDTLHLNIYQGNSLIEANNDFIGYLEFPYGRHVKANTGDVELNMSIDVNGVILVEVVDLINFGLKREIKLKGI